MFFSCIITCYNRQETIERSIKSIQNQSYQNFEIIVVDDCSQDQSIAKINSINDPRIRVIRNKENKGQNFSLNVGVEAAKYEFLGFLDSDDTWERDYLLEMSEVYKKFPEIGFAYANLVDGPEWVLEGSNKYPEVLNQGYLSSMITITAKREAVNSVGNFDLRYTICQDDDFCFRLAKKFPFKVIKSQLSRIHGAENSMTKNMLNLAKGWQFLFENYKDDILTYCGKKTYSKHMLTVSTLYFAGGSFGKGLLYYLVSLRFFFSLRRSKYPFSFSLFLKESINILKLTLRQFKTSTKNK